jgi:hypothetical protein
MSQKLEAQQTWSAQSIHPEVDAALELGSVRLSRRKESLLFQEYLLLYQDQKLSPS